MTVAQAVEQDNQPVQAPATQQWPPPHTLNDSQIRAVYAAMVYDVLFLVGGVGSGKSTVAFEIFLDSVVHAPGGLFLVGRLNYRDLDDITIPKVLEWLGPMLISYQGGDDRVATVRTQDKNDPTKPGQPARIIFRFLENTDQLG